MKEQSAGSTAERMTMHSAFEKTLPKNDQIVDDPYAIDFLEDRTKKNVKEFCRPVFSSFCDEQCISWCKWGHRF
jgi:O-methyltransferase involved in polyketide biosynthesis